MADAGLDRDDLTTDDLRRLEELVTRAMAASDVAALDRLVDDRLFFLDHEDRLVSKAEDLELHRSGALAFSTIEQTELTLRTFGTSGMALSCLNATGVLRATPFDVRLRIARIWAAVPGGARIVALRTTLARGDVWT